MADIYLKFKLRVEVRDKKIQPCIYALVNTIRKNKEQRLSHKIFQFHST